MASMAGETIAVVSSPDDHRVFFQSQFFHLIQDPANSFVDHRDLSRTAFEHFFVILPCQRVGNDDTVVFPDRNILLCKINLRLALKYAVKAGVRWIGHRLIQIVILLSRKIRLMRSPEIYSQRKWGIVPIRAQFFQLLTRQF